MSHKSQERNEQLKNDGTDPTKNDDTPDEVLATDRTCYIKIVNSSGVTLTNVALTHSSGNTNTVINAASMANGDESPPKQISFETGFNADFDYWNISFQTGGSTYDTPYNDRCNISYTDAGQTINCIVTKSGSGFNLKTSMPKSSSCDFTINKK